MKLIVTLVFAVAASLSCAQDILSNRDLLPTQLIRLDSTTPIEIQIPRNTWYDYYPELYSAVDLVAATGQMILEVAPDMVPAQPTVELLQEGNNRRALEAEEFVNKTASIFQRGTMRPAVYFLRCTYSGSATARHRAAGVRIKGTDLDLGAESGSSTAIVRYELIRRTDMVTIGVVTVKEVYSSTNVTNFNFDRFGFFSRGLGIAFAENSDPVYRRGLISTARCLDKSRSALARLLGRAR